MVVALGYFVKWTAQSVIVDQNRRAKEIAVRNWRVGLLLCLGLVSAPVCAADAVRTLPVVADVEWTPFRKQCRQLLAAADKTGSILPAETVREVRALLDGKPDDTEAASCAVQKLLDPYCLLSVDINPESRVKAARGPAVVSLQRNRQTVVLIKIHNEGGVTHELRLDGPELVSEEKTGEGRWLRATLLAEAPLRPELSGQRLEYRLLGLTPTETGKREATFRLDVGQGTQDLGFRSEVPLLFTIGEPKPKRER